MSAWSVKYIKVFSHSLHRRMTQQIKHCQRKISICVEGNIGSGKSTMLDHFEKNVPQTEVIGEPVSLWQNFCGCNLLDMMYKDPKRWSYTFQTYTLLTMMKIHNSRQEKEHRIIERSAYSAVYCFVENLYRSGNLSHLEYTLHHEWFDWITKIQKPKIDIIVYIRTPPETCLDRLRKRGRKEEQGISLELLQQIHNCYEEWLVRRRKFSLPAPVLVVDGDQSIKEMIEYYHEHIASMLECQSSL